MPSSSVTPPRGLSERAGCRVTSNLALATVRVPSLIPRQCSALHRAIPRGKTRVISEAESSAVSWRPETARRAARLAHCRQGPACSTKCREYWERRQGGLRL